MSLDRYELPEAMNEELAHFAISPAEKVIFSDILTMGISRMLTLPGMRQQRIL